MWDTAPAPSTQHLTHDMPCPQCGHATHTYLPCSETCACRPAWLAIPAASLGDATYAA